MRSVSGIRIPGNRKSILCGNSEFRHHDYGIVPSDARINDVSLCSITHVLEPRYPAARERYVDLTPCCDLAAAKELAPELTACADGYRAAYQNAYHVLRALGSIESERCALVHEGLDRQKLLHRAAGIAAREFKGKGTLTGRTARVFLGGPTCLGMLERFDSAEALCPRIYELHDSYALAVPLLRFLHRAALDAGEDVLLCPDALHPSEPRHLLIPSRGLAFLTVCGGQGCTKAPYRRLRIDAMAEQSLSRTQKAHLRLLRRLHRELETEATDALARARHGHDALELLYRPCMSFAAVDALCEEEIARMCRYIG